MHPRFHTTNRKKLIEHMQGDLVILTAYTAQQQSGDTSFGFEQEASFWYLTGIEYADWRLVIDAKKGTSWLIAPAVDEMHQLFDGSLSRDAAKGISGVDAVLDQKAGEQLFRDLANTYTNVATLDIPPYATYVDFALNPAQAKLTRQLKRLFGTVNDCSKEIMALRAIKQPIEIKAMEDAATVSVEAFKSLQTKLPSCQYEYEAEAELAYYFRRRNATHAFEPIVASGKNACTLHYVENSAKLQPGLLLIDAGACKNGYPADITRTFAIGQLTSRQGAVHEAVRDVEQKIIQLIVPGLQLKEYIQSVDAVMKEALLSLDLLKDANDHTTYRRYFPHAVSHGLGIDVHESLGGYAYLKPGMVLTVEPGIYIPEENIGVRIEDDILITAEGHRNLTAGLSTEL